MFDLDWSACNNEVLEGFFDDGKQGSFETYGEDINEL